MLVLQAPDGQHTTIGQVSDGVRIHDISSNARTVVTGFTANGGEELRLTIWDTESRTPSYLRVAGGDEARLVSGGVYVSRYGQAPQLYSRTGTLLKTYAGTAPRSSRWTAPWVPVRCRSTGSASPGRPPRC